MSVALIRKVAFRYLKPSQKEGFVSVIAGFSFLGIMLGVATLIIVMAVMNGFREDLFARILGFNGHIAVTGMTSQGLTDYEAKADKIRAIESVVSVTPVIEAQSVIMQQGVVMGVLVHGITLENLQKRELISNHIVIGSLDKFTQPNAIVIGKSLAQKLGVMPGDSITLAAPEGNATAFGMVPRMRKFIVAGIFDVGMKDYDSNVAFIPLESAQKFYRLPDAVSGIEIFVKDPQKIQKSMKEIFNTLEGKVRMIDWQKANEKFAVAVEVERNVMFTILTLIIIVASFNIVSSLIMLVKDKVQDIAILRTMGATQGMIMAIFFVTGSIIGVTGILAGSVLGILFALNIESIRQFVERLSGTNLFSPEIYFLTKLPAKLDSFEVGAVIVMAFILVFLASLYPAWRAAKLDPIEALRYE
ncbi:MAG: lipoprotein-releasing ABC transporter permease subunit [Janthinobacterium lividum]